MLVRMGRDFNTPLNLLSTVCLIHERKQRSG
jgi:hypothetical protein